MPFELLKKKIAEVTPGKRPKPLFTTSEYEERVNRHAQRLYNENLRISEKFAEEKRQSFLKNNSLKIR